MESPSADINMIFRKIKDCVIDDNIRKYDEEWNENISKNRHLCFQNYLKNQQSPTIE